MFKWFWALIRSDRNQGGKQRVEPSVSDLPNVRQTQEKLPALPIAPPDPPIFAEFYNSIAGVTFSNPDGRSRQDIIRRSVRVGIPLSLRFEDNNPVDKDAVALFTPDGDQVGYLKQRTAWDVRDHIKRERHVEAVVAEVRGATPEFPKLAVIIQVKVRAAPAPPPTEKPKRPRPKPKRAVQPQQDTELPPDGQEDQVASAASRPNVAI